MAYIKNWVFAYNQLPLSQPDLQNQAASFHHQRKTFLVDNGWTVVQSCDGTAYGEGDLLTDLTKYVWSTSAGRTWMVLKSPEGFYAGLDGTYTGDQSRMWVTIRLSNASQAYQEIYFHNVAPTGTVSVSACPTSTTQTGFSAQQILRSPYTANAIFHFACTSQGNWIEMIGNSATGIIPYALLVCPMTELARSYIGQKDYPYGVAMYSLFSTTDGGLTGDNNNSGLLNAQTYWRSWVHTGAAADTRLFCLMHNAGGVNDYCYGRAIGWDFTSTVRDGYSWTIPETPLYVYLQNAAAGFHIVSGKIADITLTGAWDMRQGDVDNAADPKYVYVGWCWIPTNTFLSL